MDKVMGINVGFSFPEMGTANQWVAELLSQVSRAKYEILFGNDLSGVLTPGLEFIVDNSAFALVGVGVASLLLVRASHRNG